MKELIKRKFNKMLTDEEKSNIKEEEAANPSCFPSMSEKMRYILFVSSAVLGIIALNRV